LNVDPDNSQCPLAGDGDGHGHSHAGKHSGNINLRGAVIHILGDLVQSVGVAFAGALIWWKQACTVTRQTVLASLWFYAV